ncbi:Glycosyltransferase involved in cell wall bisynthesis [Planctomycetales bacterium 10988]|nr:Glycosyltransferase involved in cell wall bisynthesis [Planctomycetales bacterium 10988]
MKLLTLIEVPHHVCYRYRVEAFQETASARGWQISTKPLAVKTWERCQTLRSAKEADVVLLQRRLLPMWQLALLRSAAKYLVYDLDDAVFLRDSNANKPPLSRSRFSRFWATLQMADQVIVGNRHLESTVAKYLAADRIRRIPTCVDLKQYPEPIYHQKSNPNNNLRLVWIGSQSTLPSLNPLQSAFQELSRDPDPVELKIICDRFPEFPGVRLHRKFWSQETEVSELQDAEIGISWLPDHPWSYAKCGLKVLQYMAAGLPVVANSIAMHRELVRHGRTGFLTDTPQDFVKAVQRLAADPELRRRMGEAGRAFIRKHYHLQNWSETFLRTLTPPSQQAQLPTTVRIPKGQDLAKEQEVSSTSLLSPSKIISPPIS